MMKQSDQPWHMGGASEGGMMYASRYSNRARPGDDLHFFNDLDDWSHWALVAKIDDRNTRNACTLFRQRDVRSAP